MLKPNDERDFGYHLGEITREVINRREREHAARREVELEPWRQAQREEAERIIPTIRSRAEQAARHGGRRVFLVWLNKEKTGSGSESSPGSIHEHIEQYCRSIGLSVDISTSGCSGMREIPYLAAMREGIDITDAPTPPADARCMLFAKW